jgi:hypothetical protein
MARSVDLELQEQQVLPGVGTTPVEGVEFDWR